MSKLFAAVIAAILVGLLSFWVQEAAGLLLVGAAAALLVSAVLLVLSARR
ncbi:hypothetical protein [Ramlibacter rhizophilus]|nr:hypothetical protein [Ramlibacter rhizophilus]